MIFREDKKLQKEMEFKKDKNIREKRLATNY